MLNPTHNFLSYEDMLAAVRAKIHIIPKDTDLIVGIPRSGMIPAYAIGLSLNIPVTDIESFISNRMPGHGQTRKIRKSYDAPLEARSILLVDDSISSGKSLQVIKERIGAAGFAGKITTCCVVCAPFNEKNVDISFITMDLPRVFEWNLFHHEVVAASYFDMDGVLCVDPTEEDNDDGKRYLHFLRNARPLYIPSQEIACIVSARLEKYRAETEEWLKSNNVKYGKLMLLDLPTKEDRQRTGAHITHKIAAYKASEAKLFVESSLEQAMAIARETGRPVMCIETMRMIQGGGIHAGNFLPALRQHKTRLRNRLKGVLKKVLPQPLIKALKR